VLQTLKEVELLIVVLRRDGPGSGVYISGGSANVEWMEIESSSSCTEVSAMVRLIGYLLYA
jgi:hypothetical protein